MNLKGRSLHRSPENEFGFLIIESLQRNFSIEGLHGQFLVIQSTIFCRLHRNADFQGPKSKIVSNVTLALKKPTVNMASLMFSSMLENTYVVMLAISFTKLL